MSVNDVVQARAKGGLEGGHTASSPAATFAPSGAFFLSPVDIASA